MVANHSFSRMETSELSSIDDGRFVSNKSTSTGYGQHADYVFGWRDNKLQVAMDNGCYLRNCSRLASQTPEVKNKCTVPDTVGEDIDGCEIHPVM